MARIISFECGNCGATFAVDTAQTVCPKDGGLLYARYDLAAIRRNASRDSISTGPKSMWRYAAVLPDVEPVTIGEGFTPMLPSRKHPSLLLKDDGLNPTGSSEARGMSAAVTMARHYGTTKLAVSSAGNSGGALAAYAAAAGLNAHIFMPKDAPIAHRLQIEAGGAHLTLVDGPIRDCERMVAERQQQEGWFDLSALKETFRVEGMKTIGYEVAEQMGWKLPDAMLFPAGEGPALIGTWKAFEEMEELGWINKGKRPKMMVAIHKNLHETNDSVLNIVRRSGGTSLAITSPDMMDAVKEMASTEGIFAAPEGGAALAAYQQLLASKFLAPSDRVVLFNPASGYKYLDLFAKYWGVQAFSATTSLPPPRNVGGIIGPY